MRSFSDSSARRFVLAAALVLIVAASPLGIAFARDGVVDSSADSGVSPDRLVIVYEGRPGADAAIRREVRAATGGALIRANRGVPTDVVRVKDAAAAAERVRRLPGVRDAYPDAAASIRLTVNDQLLNKEWGIAKIQAPTAWDTFQGAGIRVAVLDCGIHSTHPDLVGKVVLERNFTRSSNTDDLCNHGTHVAGTIGAVTDNGIGVAAVAPGALLINGKVLGDGGSGWFSDIDAGIEWAADNGARVINMSFGGLVACPTGTQAAIDYAWNKGTLPIAAAGNSATDASRFAPANCNHVMSVAATDSRDRKASFSNYGLDADIAAPGASILSTVNPDRNRGTSYASFSGTSMASPHTAGVAALIWSTSYGTSPASVQERLFSTADAISGTGTNWRHGRVDAAAAVAGAGPAPDLPPPPPLPAPPGPLTISSRGNAARLSWAASVTDRVTYTVYRGTVPGGWKGVQVQGLTNTRYDDRRVVRGQIYCWSVTARNETGESLPSNEVCVTP